MSRSKYFVIANYKPDSSGTLKATIPSSGPCKEMSSSPCQIAMNHYRPRKTGPCFPIVVVECKTHKIGFTLYPTGHVPHGRTAIAPVSPDGMWPFNEGKEKDNDREEVFKNTIFQVAFDASNGNPWPRSSATYEQNTPEHYWSGMWRNLDRLTVLFGIHERSEEKIQEIVAQNLKIDLLNLKEQSVKVRENPGYKSRGRAICQLLSELPQGDSFLIRILRCGTHLDFWGIPYWLDDKTGRIRKLTYFSP